jgi:excisionase family DNA binding protein
MPEPIYLNTEQIARRYDVNEDTARRWIRTGRIPGMRLGGAYRVRLDDLERLEQEGEDFTIETPLERPEVDALLQQLEDMTSTLPNGQAIDNIIGQLRQVLGTVSEERITLNRIERLLQESRRKRGEPIPEPTPFAELEDATAAAGW